MPRLVLDLADRRPIYDMPDAVLHRIRAALPEDWEIHVVSAPADGTGDGGAQPVLETLDAVREADIYIGQGVHPDVMEAGRRLRWVHTGTAGVGSALARPMIEHEAVFTNSAGVYGPPMAETVIGFMLHFARGIDYAVQGARDARWWRAPYDGPEAPVREIDGSVVGVVGLGGVGCEVARRARALGARVLGLKRSPAEIDGIEVLTGDSGFQRLLQASDYVVLTVPETPETVGMIDAAAIARMKRGAVLINVARGSLVAEDALLGALDEGRLRGAGLDVFADEPPPEGHPFWRHPRVLVTPHMSGYSHRYWEREGALILDNLRRFLEGRSLRNVVDKAAGY